VIAKAVIVQLVHHARSIAIVQHVHRAASVTALSDQLAASAIDLHVHLDRAAVDSREAQGHTDHRAMVSALNAAHSTMKAHQEQVW
jgi:hypothetical protein